MKILNRTKLKNDEVDHILISMSNPLQSLNLIFIRGKMPLMKIKLEDCKFIAHTGTRNSKIPKIKNSSFNGQIAVFAPVCVEGVSNVDVLFDLINFHFESE